jgi:Secretion system C-terminal sorting domain
MKKITQKSLLLFLFVLANVCYSQKVAIIGINHLTPDGFTFVVTQDIASGEVIYFTENEYNDASNAFVDQTESVVIFTANAAILKGNVIFVNEGVADTFSVSCTSGVCGTAVKTGASGNFALATDGETLYAYTDADLNPANGVTTIYSAMYTGSGETVPPVNGGNIPVAQDPTFDYPTAIVVDGFPAVQPNRVEFITATLARTGVSKVMLENPSNYVHAQANAALSTIIFTTFLGNEEFELNSKFTIYPNPSNSIVAITSDFDGDFQVLNQLGQQVNSFKVSANIVKTINIENLAQGIYFIKGVDGTKTGTQKLIIK